MPARATTKVRAAATEATAMAATAAMTTAMSDAAMSTGMRATTMTAAVTATTVMLLCRSLCGKRRDGNQARRYKGYHPHRIILQILDLKQ